MSGIASTEDVEGGGIGGTRAGLRDFWDVYEATYDQNLAVLMARVQKMKHLGPIFASASPEDLERQRKAGHEQMRAAFLDDDWSAVRATQKAQGSTYAALGVPFHEWFDIISAFQVVVTPVLIERFGSDPKRLGEALVAMSAYLDSSMSLVGDEYVATKERIITQQQEAIKELSTPVLQIRDRLLLVPLVGLLDTQRARAMTEQLLHAIRAHRAKVVVIDITGVPAVDSKVAHHLFQTLSAARLMGAHTVVTGVSAEVAESLVVLGVDIEALNTVGDLQGGLEEAERWLAHKRAPVDESAPLEPVGRA